MKCNHLKNWNLNEYQICSLEWTSEDGAMPFEANLNPNGPPNTRIDFLCHECNYAWGGDRYSSRCPKWLKRLYGTIIDNSYNVIQPR